MQHLAPAGPVYQAGTLSGNPVAMAAGMATLTKLQTPGFYEKLSALTQYLVEGLRTLSEHNEIPLCINAAPGLFSLFFTSSNDVSRYQQVMNCSVEKFQQFYHAMLHEGIYLAPSAFECGFLSITHTKEYIDRTLQAAENAFQKMKLVETCQAS